MEEECSNPGKENFLFLTLCLIDADVEGKVVLSFCLYRIYQMALYLTQLNFVRIQFMMYASLHHILNTLT